MRISTYLIGISMIGLIFSLFYGITTNLASDDYLDIDFDDSYESEFNAIVNISNQISGDYEEVGNWSVDKDSFLGLSPDSISLVKNMIKAPFSITGVLIEKVGEYLQLPSWATQFISTILLILLVFALVALIQKYRYA